MESAVETNGTASEVGSWLGKRVDGIVSAQTLAEMKLGDKSEMLKIKHKKETAYERRRGRPYAWGFSAN